MHFINMPPVDQIISQIWAFLSGSLFTAFLSIVFDMKNKKSELSVKILENYFNEANKLSDAYRVLNSEGPLSIEQEDKVRYMADWFDVFCSLFNHGQLDRKIITNAGLNNVALGFYEKVNSDNRFSDIFNNHWREFHKFRNHEEVKKWGK